MIAHALTPEYPTDHDPQPADPDELAAVRAALEGDLPTRLRIIARTLRRVLANPEDTQQVLVLFIALNARQIPRFFLRFVSEPGGDELLRDRPAIDSHSVDLAALGRLPADTLGGAYARHMAENGLSPDIFRAPPGISETLAYVGQRMRQTHDVWHVVAGYGTSVSDELALLAFSYGQMHLPGPALLAVIGATRWSLRYPDVFARVFRGWRRGKAARSLLTVRWEDLWALPLSEVRARYGVAPEPAA